MNAATTDTTIRLLQRAAKLSQRLQDTLSLQQHYLCAVADAATTSAFLPKTEIRGLDQATALFPTVLFEQASEPMDMYGNLLREAANPMANAAHGNKAVRSLITMHCFLIRSELKKLAKPLEDIVGHRNLAHASPIAMELSAKQIEALDVYAEHTANQFQPTLARLLREFDALRMDAEQNVSRQR